MNRFFLYCFLLALTLGMPQAYAAAIGTKQPGKEAPIAIDADSLEVIQSQNKAIFKGNVVAKQGDMTLRAAIMTVFYGEQKQNAQSKLGSLSRIVVDGNVSLITPTESATAAHGVYDAVNNKVFLTQQVVLKRAGNVLNGSALEYNIATGSSVLSGGVRSDDTPQPAGTPPKTRVRGLFIPEGK